VKLDKRFSGLLTFVLLGFCVWFLVEKPSFTTGASPVRAPEAFASEPASGPSPFGQASVSQLQASAPSGGRVLPQAAASLTVKDDLTSWLNAVWENGNADQVSAAAMLSFQCGGSESVRHAGTVTTAQRQLIMSALTGERNIPAVVAEAKEAADSKLLERCRSSNITMFSFEKRAAQLTESSMLKKLIRSGDATVSPKARNEVLLTLLGSPSSYPEAFDHWLSKDLWATPTLPANLSHFERAFVEDLVYRSFVPDPSDSYRNLMRCASLTKCRPELVVPADRQVVLRELSQTVAQAIRSRQFQMLSR
jgi:hypothetical protein